ncbi:hypothetical protein [Actinacidiphila oryziradicis]|uniref:Uncharacterized protein n=1 Tax=Actinacidiphila oryziradicis TaxID=2571141 RepID=A0A4U0T8J3_9ACTN|nr:hypothetical protein [Actinacidiphila oryziradicis]TKA10765.1 hypothetical protein FCI23_15850 [Actinacidiphila oryziradicis]
MWCAQLAAGAVVTGAACVVATVGGLVVARAGDGFAALVAALVVVVLVAGAVVEADAVSSSAVFVDALGATVDIAAVFLSLPPPLAAMTAMSTAKNATAKMASVFPQPLLGPAGCGCDCCQPCPHWPGVCAMFPPNGSLG